MHVAIIPDGLRRWARLHGISYEESYNLMCEKLVNYAEQAFDFGANAVTLYLSSAINFTRTYEDIEAGCMAEHRGRSVERGRRPKVDITAARALPRSIASTGSSPRQRLGWNWSVANRRSL